MSEQISQEKRQSLINDFEILGYLNPGKKEIYDEKIFILQNGFTGLYHKVFDSLTEEIRDEYFDSQNLMKWRKDVGARIAAFTKFIVESNEGQKDAYEKFLGRYKEQDMYDSFVSLRKTVDVEKAKNDIADAESKRLEGFLSMLP